MWGCLQGHPSYPTESTRLPALLNVAGIKHLCSGALSALRCARAKVPAPVLCASLGSSAPPSPARSAANVPFFRKQ